MCSFTQAYDFSVSDLQCQPPDQSRRANEIKEKGKAEERYIEGNSLSLSYVPQQHVRAKAPVQDETLSKSVKKIDPLLALKEGDSPRQAMISPTKSARKEVKNTNLQKENIAAAKRPAAVASHGIKAEFINTHRKGYKKLLDYSAKNSSPHNHQQQSVTPAQKDMISKKQAEKLHSSSIQAGDSSSPGRHATVHIAKKSHVLHKEQQSTPPVKKDGVTKGRMNSPNVIVDRQSNVKSPKKDHEVKEKLNVQSGANSLRMGKSVLMM